MTQAVDNDHSSQLFLCCSRVKQRKTSLGFTLVEILLVVALIAILAGLSLPRFSKTYAHFQLQTTAGQITDLMRYAQGRAITKKRTLKLEFDPSYKKYRLSEEKRSPWQDDEEVQEFEEIPGRFGREFLVAENISVEYEDPDIRFYPDGKIDPARIYVCEKNENCLTVSTQEQYGHVQTFEGKI
ncbi:MAG: GspH/FimT family pseudopilin [Candidatus Omnitrophota bacterium]